MHQVCNIDELIRISPFAVMFLFRASINLLVNGTRCASYLSSKALLCMAVYATGLTVLDKRQTQSNIAETLGYVTHDDLNRLANELKDISRRMIMELTIFIIDMLGPGFIILDDVIVPKPFSRYVAGAYMDYDYSQKRHIVCHRIVVIIWTNGTIYIPLAFAFWHDKEFVRKYRTKNQIARILVYHVVRNHIPFSYLAFDNWYASKQNLGFFSRLGIKFVTRLRKNTWVIHDDERKKVSQLTKSEYHYYSKLDVYVRRFEVRYPSFIAGHLAIVKNDKHDEPGRTKYLFTNDLSLTNMEIVLNYRSRWHIEFFFRACKQRFGLSACQAQLMPQVVLHVRMVFMTYVLTQLLMVDNSMSIEQKQKHLRSLHCLYLPGEAPKLMSMQTNGILAPVTLEELVSPIRTRLPNIMNAQMPDITEFFIDA